MESLKCMKVLFTFTIVELYVCRWHLNKTKNDIPNYIHHILLISLPKIHNVTKENGIFNFACVMGRLIGTGVDHIGTRILHA
nr:hypothetical protein Itr_chr13CG20300 [Ipomoea trifida]